MLQLVAVTIPVPVFGTVPTCNGEVDDDVTTRSCRFNPALDDRADEAFAVKYGVAFRRPPRTGDGER